MDKKSFFLVLDGIDGSGTTTHSKMLVSYLEMLGLKVHLTQEPSKNEIGLLLRQYLKNNEIHRLINLHDLLI
ncbi:MAG: dTMP kinase [Promethearchaeota archaeon]